MTRTLKVKVALSGALFVGVTTYAICTLAQDVQNLGTLMPGETRTIVVPLSDATKAELDQQERDRYALKVALKTRVLTDEEFLKVAEEGVWLFAPRGQSYRMPDVWAEYQAALLHQMILRLPRRTK